MRQHGLKSFRIVLDLLMSVSSPRPEPPLLIPKMINTALDRHIHHPCSRKQDFCWQQVQCVQKLIDDTETLMFVTTRNFSEGWLSALAAFLLTISLLFLVTILC